METNLSLVRLNTQDVAKALPVTDTTIVAEKFGVNHLSVVKLVEKHKDDLIEFGKLVSFQMTLNNSKRTTKCYELNEQQFSLLVMYMKNTEIARKYKKLFVHHFYLMRNELQARVETRKFSKQTRKSLTDTIKDKVSDDGNFKKYAYGNYSKLVYKVVTGMDVKKYKSLHGLKEKDNIRDFFSLEEIEKVQELESKIAYYIEMRTDITGNDKETYAEVKKYVDSLKEQNKLLT